MSLYLSWEGYQQDVFNKLFIGVQYVYGCDVEGDIAEFGTFTGDTAMVLAHGIAGCDQRMGYALRAAGLPPKRLHLFDSFKGLPEMSEDDKSMPHVQTGVWSPGALRGLPIEQLLDRCSPPLERDRISVYDGWFADTVKTIPDGSKFALLHVDGDLYSSAMDVLVPMFERRMVSEGAMIFFDDWNCNRASPEHGERRAWAECVERFGIKYSDAGEYGMVSHKFIVHSY